ncbi:MAG: NfeD family protein, partial [Anaerolineales bacterium]
WVTVAVVTLASTGGFGWLVKQGLAAQALPVAQDPNRVVGAHGVARTDVLPDSEGTVYVAGELWSASADSKIPANSQVVVVSREGLRLKVMPADKVSLKV